MKEKIQKNGSTSLLGLLIFCVVIVLIFSYFKINVKTVLESPEGQSNVSYVNGVVKSVWDDYLKEPTTYLWNNAVNLFWKSFLDNMTGKGSNTNFEKLAPSMPFGNSNSSNSSN